MRRLFGSVVVVFAAIHVARGCRSSPDADRIPLHGQRGTEPPEAAHRKPSGDPNVISKTDLDPNDPDREREEGEVKSGERWEFPVAQAKSGSFWGTIEESRGGKRILAFRGIPYARPPIAELRFRPPVPLGRHDGLKEAKVNGHVCPQHMYYKPDIWIGAEDCLWLSVFTRDLVLKKKRPVLVWFHGGNFVRGSAADYEPDYLLDEEMVLVTVNYRLGLFGFMSTEDEHAPGNYGMLDQVAALQWVRKNIESFSGDPTRITIAGQQAGGASVHYHMLSPLTRGLFHQAISMSGSALCWWASIKRPLEKAQKMAKLLECKEAIAKDGSTDNKLLLQCFRGKSMEQLMNTHPNFYEWKHLEQGGEPITAFSPRVDPESRMPYMPSEPIDLMTSGGFQHIPWIAGLTDDEGAFKGSTFIADMKGVREFEEQYEKLGPLMFGLHDGMSEAPKVNAQRVRDYYWGAAAIDKDNVQKVVNAISDSSYSHPIDTASKIHAMKSQSPVYVYHFGYRGQFSLTQLDVDNYPPKIVPKDVKFGVGNGDDLIYLFPLLAGIFRPLPKEDLIFSQRFVELLGSFVRTGTPSIEMGEDAGTFVWNRVLSTNATHLDIGNEMRMDDGLPNHERMNFWQKMPVYWNANRAGYKPAPPISWKNDEL